MHPDKPSDPPIRSLTCGRWRLSYTDEGEGDQTIVAIAGLPGSVRDFRWLAPVLSGSVRFVRLDLPGFGQSPREGYSWMTVAERAEAVGAFIETLGLAPVSLVSHSSGGTVAVHLARHRPKLVRRCALIASPGPQPHYPITLFRVLCRAFAWRLGRLLMRPALRQLYRAAGFPAYLTDDERMYTSLDSAGTDFEAYADNVSKVEQPLLIAWARDDKLIPSTRYEALERIASPGPRLHFDTGGHNIQKTQAVELSAAILEHIS